jgi:tellurite resistance protein TerB
MALWDQLKDRTAVLGEQLTTKREQLRSKDFAEASMAVCALVAAADGTIDPAERARTAALIASNDTLSVFATDDLRRTFDRYCDKLSADYDFGKVEAVAAVGRLRSKPEQARAVIAVALVIGAADGTFDAAERKVVTEACHAVGIAPSEFDL